MPEPTTDPRKRVRSRPARPRRSLPARMMRGLFRLIWIIGSRLTLAALVVLALATGWSYATLPAMTDLLDGRERGSVVIEDRAGQVFAWRGEQFMGTLRSETASKDLVNAVVATEDKRYFSHPGLDPIGIARAFWINFKAGRVVQGGSTITQQVAKLLFFDQSRSYERHLRQIPVVLAMELKYSKADILSIYLNRVYLGAGTNGFEAAARRYFGRSAREVDAAEAAMLAGLLQAPSRYAPTSNLGRAQGRAGVIINLMEAQGYLSADKAAWARANPAQLSAAAEARAGGYFADWIMEEAPDFLTRDTTEDVTIRSSFDPDIQAAAEAALSQVFATKVRKGSRAQAAIVVLSPDGAVRAMVGGRSGAAGGAGQFNRATQALRQTGSSFKPFVYGAALEQGYPPNATVEDAPITVDVPGSKPWSPQNYTREYFGQVTLAEALARSLNTAAVRVALFVGPERIRALARDFGVRSPLDKGPAFALGTSEATLLEMVGAYAGFLNEGRQVTPYGLTELWLRDEKSPLFEGARSMGPQVMAPKAARQLVWMLHQVVETGSGQRARLKDRPAAGKTGTTQGARDAWFIGFTAHYVAGVWMGYDDNSKLTGVTGGGLPAEIWRETMERIHTGLPPRPLPMSGPGQARPVPQTPVEATSEGVIDQLLNNLFGG